MTLAPETPDYALDVVSFVEAILEEPTAILMRQLDKKKGELIASWKAEGIEYDERMRRLDGVTWDKPKAELLKVIEALTSRYAYDEVIPVSAADGENTDRLVEIILSKLPQQGLLFPEDMLTDQAEMFLAAEFIREQLMLQTSQELPYSVAVEIERFVDAPRKNIIEIMAVIHVERKSQKSIIIGSQGSRIKAIGQAARIQMEQFFGKKVFLETFVRVQENWSEDQRSLQRFGYE